MKNALNKFKLLTGYDIELFFNTYVSFSNTLYPNIVSYYTGGTADVSNSFRVLDVLIKQSTEIEPLFSLRQNSLNTIDFWEILDMFTECQTKLWTINNSSRWLRSTAVGRRDSGIVINRSLKSRETFEDVMFELGSNVPQDSWFDVSLGSTVTEEDYTSNDGSVMFKINMSQYGNFDIQNIVDNLSSEKILGKDISVEFKITDNDFVCVEYDSAVRQSLNTIISSLKGSIPEYIEYGLPHDTIGSSINAIQYPSIFKHLLDMFQRDGRWVEVNLLDVYAKDDYIFLKINAKTVTNNYLITNIQI